MHPCQENWVAIGRAVVNCARVAQEFSTGIKCWHCMSEFLANGYSSESTQ